MHSITAFLQHHSLPPPTVTATELQHSYNILSHGTVLDNAVSYTVRSTSVQSPVTGIEDTLTGLELETDYPVSVTFTNECGVESPPSQDITVRIDIQGRIYVAYSITGWKLCFIL